MLVIRKNSEYHMNLSPVKEQIFPYLISEGKFIFL